MKKLQSIPLEIDLVVEPTHLTDKEMKEIGEFIAQLRRNKKLSKMKHRKAALVFKFIYKASGLNCLEVFIFIIILNTFFYQVKFHTFVLSGKVPSLRK